MIHPNGKQYAKAVLKMQDGRPTTCNGCAFQGETWECAKAELCYEIKRIRKVPVMTKIWIYVEVENAR